MSVGHPDWMGNPRTTLDLVRLQPANPAAGAEYSTVVPAGERWRLIAVRFQLVTDATVGNRVAYVAAVTGARTLFRPGSNVVQVASLTRQYGFATLVGSPWGPSTPSADTMVPLGEIHLLPAEVLQIGVITMTPGDQLNDIVVTYERIAA